MSFWKWWTGIVLIIVASILFEHFASGISYLYQNDVSYISLVIVGIYAAVNLVLGYRAYMLQFKKITPTETQMQFPWFVADAVTSIGMIGTIVGFLVVLTSAFTDIDPTDAVAMKQVVEQLTTGMGIALLTTLTGLIASVIMKFQLVILESDFETS